MDRESNDSINVISLIRKVQRDGRESYTELMRKNVINFINIFIVFYQMDDESHGSIYTDQGYSSGYITGILLV